MQNIKYMKQFSSSQAAPKLMSIDRIMDRKSFSINQCFIRVILLLFLTSGCITSWGQTTLLEWNFPNNPDDEIADGGIAVNLTKSVNYIVGGGESVNYSNVGVSSSCMTVNKWRDGVNTFCYEFSNIVTTGYSAITFSGSMYGGNDNSPRDFQIQYRINNGAWTNVGSAISISAGSWLSVATNLSLPFAANQSDLDIRILKTSNQAIDGGNIGNGGAALVGIDNIIISGMPLTYYSSGSAVATNLNNWWSNTNGTGYHPTSFSADNQLLIIQNGDTYSMSAGWNITGSNSSLIVQSGGTLNCGAYILGGTTNFNLNAGATLQSGHANGLNGNIQTTGTRSFNVGANYAFNGIVAQVSGTYLPATVNNLTINNTNASGVSFTNSVTVNGILDLQQNPLNLNGRVLTLNGTVERNGAGTGTLSGSTTSSVNISGTGDLGVLYFTSGSENLLNLSVNRTSSGTVGLGTDLTVGASASGSLTLTEGIIEPASNIITLANVAEGSLIGGSETAFVNGAFVRYFPAAASGSSNYLFPVGEGGVYKGLELIDIETGTGPISANVSVSATGATTPDASITPLLSARNWYVNSSGNLSGAIVRITESGMDATNILGISTAAQSGTYFSAGGFGDASITSSTAITTFPAWFAIGTANIRTYYSYQDGSWNNPSTWTLDPSGTLQVGNTIPANGDYVVILSGRTVTLPLDVSSTGLDITIDAAGFLDMATYQFTNPLMALRGQGTLRLASVNFPTATTNTFINSGGGTTEYYNATDFTLPVSQASYNNLTINAVGVVATQLSNLALNGNLSVKSGTFRVNDNASTTALTLTINGNVIVDNGAFINVGQGTTNTAIGGSGGTAPFLNYYSNFHTIILNGDFTNNGTVRFTNLALPLYNAFPPLGSVATSGAASVYFQGNSSNTLTCNGITDFYNLIVDKGFDQTYTLTINSSSYLNFKLFGANTLAYDAGGTASNPNIRKALWMRSGTLVLKGSTIIPSLSEGTAANANYYIPSNAALKIDNSDVIVLSTADDYGEINRAYGVSGGTGLVNGVGLGGNSGLYVYGKLQMDNGYLSTRESAGIVTSNVASGQVIINGGTVDAKQFQSSTGSSASYSQTGGSLILRGRFQRNVAYSSIADLKNNPGLNTSRANNGINVGLGSFNLENTSNLFSMSGGTIVIYDVTDDSNQEAFDVKSDLANINVTGGTIDIRPTIGTVLADAVNYYINTTSALGNLTINRASSSSMVGLNANPLSILKNLTITAGDFNAHNLNLSIGGDFSIANGTSYTSGMNTTILNGTGSQTFTVNTTSAQSLNNFTISKAAGTSVSFAGTQNTINIAGEFRIELATLNDNGNTINVSGNVYNSGLHAGTGKITLNGTTAQTIDGNGTFGNLELFNTNGGAASVSLLANTAINGVLTLSNDKLFNISTFNLKLGTSASILNASSTRYLQSAGNAGDGGVTKAYTSTTPFIFPLGVTNYAPASLGFNTDPTTYGSITVKPVNYEHPNVTTTGRSLTCFWRVQSSGFTLGAATVTHGYTYNDANVVPSGDVTEDQYVAARFNASTNTWTSGDATDVDETGNIIGEPGAGSFLENATFIDGDYTAGDNNPTNPFGTPVVYYSRQSGLWSSTNTWSLTGHSGGAAPSVPGARDIVIIGGQDSVYLATWNSTENRDPRSCAALQIEAGSALDIGYNPSSSFSMVVSHINGNGNFRLTTNYNSGATFQFPTGDFTEFNSNLGTTELYTTNPTAGGTYWLPNGITSYGNLIISPLGGSNIIFPNNDVTVYGDLVTRGQNSESWFCPTWNSNYPTAPTARAAKTITIEGDFRIEGGALIYYGNNALAQNFIIYGDLFIAELAGLKDYSNASNQSITIGGSLINNSLAPAGGVNSYRGANFTDIPIIFIGDSNAFISNTNSPQDPYTVFSQVVVNKGNSQSTTLTCNIGGTQTTTPNNNWLTLQNGTFIYNRSGDFTISTTTDLTIPSTAGLTLNTPSNVYIANNATNNRNLFLNGKLTVQNGNVYIGPINNTANNADIEYSGLNAEIEVTGGNLFVNGQIRRPSSTTNGTLKYVQSNGNVVIMGNNSLVTKAKLEVLNTGSEFNMSGGTLNIVRGGGTTFGDLYLRPENSSVTGGEILFSQVPIVGATVDAAQDYILDADFALNNLTVTGKTTGTSRIATLDLNINPLILEGNLTLSNTTFSVLNTNDLNVTINGDFINYGTYNYGTNLTTFSGDLQVISGSSTTDFYDLEVSPSSSLSVNHNFSVYGDLTIGSGILGLASNLVNLTGNLTNNASFTDDNNTGGISLVGTVQQQITGTGAYGRLELDNTAGARINNDVSIQNNLVLTQGVLDINQYWLTLSQNSSILGAPFNNTKMIKSDGVTSSNGVRKFFPIISSPVSFTFPVGVTGKYTPASYSISSSATVGYINVNPINTYHPTVIGALKSDSVLQYYWQIESSGISGFSGNLVLQYVPGDVKGIENEYVAARLELPGDYWYKAGIGSGTDNVDESTHQITFNASGSSNLSADYTAGSTTAIPDQVPSYVTNKDGDWSDNTIWDPVGTAPACPAGGPNGAIVIVDHAVYTSTNYNSAYRTTINGRLEIVSPTFGHNLGTVNGVNGTLYIESGNLPAGEYAAFLECIGNGTLEYGGTGSYTNIASLYNSVPNLVFSGTGTRTLYNKDLTICNRLVIDGPTLDNSVNNKKFIIGGSMEIYNTGRFLSGTGAAPAATVSFAGTSLQTIGGPTGDFTGLNSFNNLEIDNPSGLTIGVNGSISVTNSLLLTDGVINTSATNSLTIDNISETAVVPDGGSASSFVNGPLIKQIANGQSFLYPLGKDIEKGHEFTLTSQAGTGVNLYWTAEFFTPNPTAISLTTPLVTTNTMEYWSLSTTTTADANVKIGWDTQSNLTAAMTQNGLIDMRLAEYNTVTPAWEEVGDAGTVITSGTNSIGDVTSTTTVSIATTPKDFTTASITTTKPSARFSPAGAICGNVGIPVTFTSFFPISTPYTLSYTIGGVAQTPVTINDVDLPYSLPTPTQGVYQLTGFTYNGGTPGIVDGRIVNAYTVPTVAVAGADQDKCGESGTTLEGNNPSPYSGVWSIISGAGGTLVNNNSMNTVFTGVLDEVYTLRWTISNVDCSSSDEVTIAFNILPPQPSNYTSAITPVCLESTGNLYAVPNDASATGYNWSYSGAGASFASTTNSVSIDFDATATNGILSVTAVNACGLSPVRTVSITINPRGSWVGDYNSDWFEVRNWTCPGVPLSNSEVVIPAGSLYMPEISSNGAECNNITVEPGASLTLSGSGSLDIYGDFTNDGTLSASNTSTVTFAGTTAIGGGSTNSYGNLAISGSLTAPAGNINVAGNWTNTGIFANNSGSVTFNGTATQTIESTNVETFYDVTINTGSSVDISSTSRVTVSNSLINNGLLTLKSDINSTASLIQNSVGVQATVERYLTGDKWHLLFAPLSAIPTSSFVAEGGSTNRNIYSYNEATVDYWNATSAYGVSGWTAEFSNAFLQTTKGFFFNRYRSPDRNYIQTGGFLDVSDKIVPVSYSDNGPGNITVPVLGDLAWSEFDGWNLIGNPYSSAIDWTAVLNDADIENGIYIWDPSAGNYKYFMNGGSAYNAIIGINTDGSADANIQYIPSGQGFFVKATATGTPGKDDQFTIPKTARTHTTHTFWKSGKAQINNLFRMNLSKDGFKDETVLWTVDGSTEGHDGNFDLHKRFSMDVSKPQIYTFNNAGNLFALNSFPEIGTNKDIPVGINIGAAGEYVINFTENNYEGIHIYLQDKLENTMTNARLTMSYTFNSETGNFPNRFVLHFKPNSSPIANGTISDQSVNEDEAYTFTTAIDFSDEDLDDKVSISAVCPAWLSYNSSTKTFTGTPGNSDVGTYIIKLTGTDLMNAKTEVSFNIVVVNVNDAPTLVNAIADQKVNEKSAYSFIIPDNVFNDIDLGDKLSYSAKLSDGSAMPSWLSFDAVDATFSGTCQEPCVLNIELTATDNSGASISDLFILEVLNVNDAPVLNTAIPDQEVDVNTYYSYTIPSNTFTDADADDQIRFSVNLANGDPLPDWLTFDKENSVLYGTSDYPGNLMLLVTATDSYNASVNDEFLLSVKSTTGISNIKENQVKVSPNPTKGKFIILIGSLSENLKYNISDYNGKHIKDGKITSQSTEIDMSDFADGVYFIELNNGKESCTHKLILNK